MMAAHFFVFYFGIVADITPPVALAAYAGAPLPRRIPMKRGFNATKLAIAAFIVPYIFAFSPQMLFCGCDRCLPGGADLHQRPAGHLRRRRPSTDSCTGPSPRCCGWPWLGGLGMMIPGTATDIAGFVLVVGIVLYQRFSARRAAMV